MIIDSKQAPPSIRIGEGGRLLVVKSEVMVAATKRGYVPMVIVEDVHEGKEYRLYVSAASLAAPLEKLRLERGGLTGATILVRRIGPDATSPYVLSEL